MHIRLIIEGEMEMQGKTVDAFVRELYDNPEIEFVFHKNRYMLSGWVDGDNKSYTLELWNMTKDTLAFRETNAYRERCVTRFERARIFNGLTIYEAESEIEVLFG